MKKNYFKFILICGLLFLSLSLYSQKNNSHTLDSKKSISINIPDGVFRGEIGGKYKINLTFKEGKIIKREVDGEERKLIVDGYMRELFFNSDSENKAFDFVGKLDGNYPCIISYKLIRGFDYIWIVEYSKNTNCWYE